MDCDQTSGALSEEDQTAGSGQRAGAVETAAERIFPNFFAGRDVQSHDRAGSWRAGRAGGGAAVGALAGIDLLFAFFEDTAISAGANIVQVVNRIESRRHPRRAAVTGTRKRSLHGGFVIGRENRTSVLVVSGSPGHSHERIHMQQLTVGAVKNKEEPVPVGMQ